jgi:arylsulfatase A-like enzyme
MAVLGLCSTHASSAAPAERPNIVYILADDLGYGDVRCFNPRCKIATPNIDALARQGMRFTDAHSGSSVCTPSRYGILTGRYSWRSRLKGSVLGGYSPPLIEPGRLTVASFLKRHGYRTACIGKWHLGLGWPTRTPGDFGDGIFPNRDPHDIDLSAALTSGPLNLGFDEFYGISAALDMPPFLYIENDRFVGKPTADKLSIRQGQIPRDFHVEDAMPMITRKAVAFIDARAKDSGARPFFLYFPMTAPHAPIAPNRAFQEKSGIGPYGDFVMELDDSVGALIKALERNGLDKNTLVVFTSDNGCSPAVDFASLAALGHQPSGQYRGGKADIFEGGHRIPFIARWPGKVKPGTTCADTICLTDLLATCAAIVGDTVPNNAGEDSVNLLPDLLGTARDPLREAVVHHSYFGYFALRQGPWKLAFCPDSGGWSAPRPGQRESRGLPPVQLYNLDDDPGERRNLQDKHPEIVERMTKLILRYVKEGRSVPPTEAKKEHPATKTDR